MLWIVGMLFGFGLGFSRIFRRTADLGRVWILLVLGSLAGFAATEVSTANLPRERKSEFRDLQQVTGFGVPVGTYIVIKSDRGGDEFLVYHVQGMTSANNYWVKSFSNWGGSIDSLGTEQPREENISLVPLPNWRYPLLALHGTKKQTVLHVPRGSVLKIPSYEIH